MSYGDRKTTRYAQIRSPVCLQLGLHRLPPSTLEFWRSSLDIRQQSQILLYNQPDVHKVVFFRFAVDEDIIYVNQDELINVALENRIHHPLESWWSICEAKRQYQEFK
ncbi:hypothetical protein Unana1_00998 [Umbelopsis nana]